MVDTPTGNEASLDFKDKLNDLYERTERELRQLEKKTANEVKELNARTNEELQPYLATIQNSNECVHVLDERKKELTEKLDRYEKALFESSKLQLDAIKHLTTLSTGAIVLLVTFIEKIFKEGQHWKALIGATLFFLLISILGCVLVLIRGGHLLNLVVAKRNDPLKNLGVVEEYSIGLDLLKNLSLITFTLGILSLTIFAFRNLYW